MKHQPTGYSVLSKIKKTVFLVITCFGISFINSNSPFDGPLEAGFLNPPDSIQTSVYWYWISDNISKEGVVKDLHAMKAAGINRAFIGNVGLSDIPYGKVQMLSSAWWGILHEALKTATALNIEIGIFNAPGWSQSGGPWIKPNEAMRYLTSSSIHVQGPVKFSKKLEKPDSLFQDVKLIAYPVPKNDALVLNSINGTITSLPKISNLAKLTDGNKKTGINFPEGKVFTINFTAKKAFTARSLSVSTTEHPMFARAKFQAENNKGEFETIAEFEINRSNPALNVGFEPYAPVVISFRATTASSFRLIIEDPGAGHRYNDCHPFSNRQYIDYP